MKRLTFITDPSWPWPVLVVVVAVSIGMAAFLTATDVAVSPKGFVELPTTSGPRVLVQLSDMKLVEEREGSDTVLDLREGRLVHVALGFDEVRQRMAGAR